jgi:Flp pilus assembly protein CpaB
MRSGGKTFIIAGVGLALVAVILAVLALGGGGEKEDGGGDEAKVTVVEAVVDVPANQILTSTDLIEKEVPADEVTTDSVQSIAQVVGMSYRVPLVREQRLVLSQLQPPGLSVNIASGKRAFSLPVTEESSLSGLIADGDYIDVVFKARVNQVRILSGDETAILEDEAFYTFDKIGGADITRPDVDNPMHAAPGGTGSEFLIRDDVGDNQQLEPVAKVMLQDIKILRVVRPGESFSANGQLAESAAANPEDDTQEPTTGYLILEVTNQQAELLTFIQDTRHEYQVMVRAKDDHALVNTTGITFQILYDGTDYALPMPRPVTAGPKPEIPTAITTPDQ